MQIFVKLIEYVLNKISLQLYVNFKMKFESFVKEFFNEL